jgi:hypothetical protein
MGKVLSIEAVDNGWVCKKVISEGEQARLAGIEVCQKEEEVIEWVKKNK